MRRLIKRARIGGRFLRWGWVGVAVGLALVVMIGTAGALEVKVKGVEQLTFEGTNRDPAWSPDGTKIAFVGNRSDCRGICLLDVGTKSVTELLPWSSDACCVSWSSDGYRITFTSGDVTWLIGLVKRGWPDSTVNTTNVSFTLSLRRVGSLSPNGKMFAYYCTGSGPNPTLCLAEFAEGFLNLTNGSTFPCCGGGHGEPRASSPAWSPDGTKIAFLLNDDLRVMSADLGNLSKSLIGGSALGGNGRPVWSPDGNYIALSHEKETEYSQIYVVDVQNATLVKLTSITPNGTYGYGAYTPSWSPDGKKMVFASGAQIFKIEFELDSAARSAEPRQPGFTMVLAVIALLAAALVLSKKKPQ